MTKDIYNEYDEKEQARSEIVDKINEIERLQFSIKEDIDDFDQTVQIHKKETKKSFIEFGMNTSISIIALIGAIFSKGLTWQVLLGIQSALWFCSSGITLVLGIKGVNALKNSKSIIKEEHEQFDMNYSQLQEAKQDLLKQKRGIEDEMAVLITKLGQERADGKPTMLIQGEAEKITKTTQSAQEDEEEDAKNND